MKNNNIIVCFNTIITLLFITCTIGLTIILHSEVVTNHPIEAWLSCAALAVSCTITLSMCIGLFFIDVDVHAWLEQLSIRKEVNRVRKELLDMGYIIGCNRHSTTIELTSWKEEVEIDNKVLILLEKGVPLKIYNELDDLGKVRSWCTYKDQEIPLGLEELLCDISTHSAHNLYTPAEYIEL